jgi:folate-dependent phosphoribosylglycinamide formyltransferase PurN
MAEKKVRLACIASGSGTDFKSIADAWKAGWIPEVSEVVLISTKEDAGCLAKADALGIRHKVVRPGKKRISEAALKEALSELGGVDLIFLVGCIVWVPNIGIPIYNIHPADPCEHGGQNMYGLEVHVHVLRQIVDEIKREWKRIESDRFYTYPTVHEASAGYDQGQPLLRAPVEIPQQIIGGLMSEGLSFKEAAEALQKHVLPYEWLMLPLAVRMAAKKIIDHRG